jgi:hypothetical protein
LFQDQFWDAAFLHFSRPRYRTIENGRIRGIVEVKSTRKYSYEIFPSEHEQVEFYKLYITKRGLPTHENTYFLTLKGISDSPGILERKLVDFLSSTGKFEKESVEDFATSHGYLTKEVEKSLEDIWQVLNERIKLLTQDSPPSEYCRWHGCSFRELCEMLNVSFN